MGHFSNIIVCVCVRKQWLLRLFFLDTMVLPEKNSPYSNKGNNYSTNAHHELFACSLLYSSYWPLLLSTLQQIKGTYMYVHIYISYKDFGLVSFWIFWLFLFPVRLSYQLHLVQRDMVGRVEKTSYIFYRQGCFQTLVL